MTPPAEHPSVNWHPDRGEPTEPAKTVCRACLVRARCLQYALDLPESDDHGVWGGTSRNERREARELGLAETLIAELQAAGGG